MLNQAQDVQGQYVRPWYLTAAKVVGQNGALLGVAAFWHVGSCWQSVGRWG